MTTPADSSSHNIKSANNGAKQEVGPKKEDASFPFPSMPPLLPLASSFTGESENLNCGPKQEPSNATYQSIVHQFDSSRPSIAEVLFSNADISQVEHSIDYSVLHPQKIKKQQDEQTKQEEQRQRDSSKGKEKKNHDTSDIKNKKDVSSSTVERQSKSQNNNSLYHPQQPVPASSNNYWQQQYPSLGHRHGPRAAHPYTYPPPSSSSYHAYPLPPPSHPPCSYANDYNSNSQYQQPRYNQSAYHNDYRQPYGHYPQLPTPAPCNPYSASSEPASSTLTESLYTASAANYEVPPPMPKYDAQYEEHLQKRMRITDGPSLNTLTFPTNNTWKGTKEEEEERARVVEEIYEKRKGNFDEEHESLVRDVLGSSYRNDDDSSTSSIEYTKKESGSTGNKERSGDEPKKDGYLMRKDITIQELRNAKVIRRKKIIVEGAGKNDVVVNPSRIKRYYACNHCGNSQFNELIRNNVGKWRACPQTEQYQLIEGIKAKIEELDPPGRFLKLVEKTEEADTDKFRVMNNTEVHTKIKVSLVGKSRKLDLDELLDNAPFGDMKQKDNGPSLQDLQQKYKEKLIMEPTKHDVLPVASLRAGLKQDYKNANYEGNKHFMDLINSKVEQYAKACSKATLDKDLKFQLIFDVMDQMKALDPPGRFLREVGMNAYVPMISEKVYERIRRQFTSTMKERGLLQQE